MKLERLQVLVVWHSFMVPGLILPRVHSLHTFHGQIEWVGKGKETTWSEAEGEIFKEGWVWEQLAWRLPETGKCYFHHTIRVYTAKDDILYISICLEYEQSFSRINITQIEQWEESMWSGSKKKSQDHVASLWWFHMK